MTNAEARAWKARWQAVDRIVAGDRRRSTLNERFARMEVDLSLGALPFEHEMIRRARAAVASRLSIRIPAPEDLVVLKAVAHRPIDGSDIEGILVVNPGIDLRRVRRWVRPFASVLEEPELVRDLEAAIKRARARAHRP